MCEEGGGGFRCGEREGQKGQDVDDTTKGGRGGDVAWGRGKGDDDDEGMK